MVLRRSLETQGLAVDGGGLFGGGPPRKLGDPPQTSPGQLLPEFGIGQNVADGRGDRRNSWFDQEAAITHYFGQARPVRRDRWDAAGHRFERSQAETLVER